MSSTPPPAATDALRSVHTSNLPALFAELQVSLVVSTYQAGKVILIRNDANNRAAGTVTTVLPMRSNISRVYPFELLIDPKESGLTKPSKVQAQQIRTIAKGRITGAPVARLTLETLKRVEGAIRLHLALT